MYDCNISTLNKGLFVGGHLQEKFLKLRPISCNLEHFVIIFVSFSKAIFLENLARESSMSLKYDLSKVW